MGKFKEMDLLHQEQERAAPVQDPCGWQFYQDGKWHNGMETHNHRANTEAAGVPVRDVFPAAQPAPWVGLTKDEVDEIWGRLLHRDSRALAIEQRLKEKNRG